MGKTFKDGMYTVVRDKYRPGDCFRQKEEYVWSLYTPRNGGTGTATYAAGELWILMEAVSIDSHIGSQYKISHISGAWCYGGDDWLDEAFEKIDG